MQEHALLEVDIHNFSAALHDGALEACLRFVERRDAAAPPDPARDCKLAEALLHDGRRADVRIPTMSPGYSEIMSLAVPT